MQVFYPKLAASQFRLNRTRARNIGSGRYKKYLFRNTLTNGTLTAWTEYSPEEANLAQRLEVISDEKGDRYKRPYPFRPLHLTKVDISPSFSGANTDRYRPNLNSGSTGIPYCSHYGFTNQISAEWNSGSPSSWRTYVTVLNPMYERMPIVEVTIPTGQSSGPYKWHGYPYGNVEADAITALRDRFEARIPNMRPPSDFLAFALELRSASSLITSFIGRWGSIVSSLASVASAYVGYQFGWAPFISDLQHIAGLCNPLMLRYEQLLQGAGKIHTDHVRWKNPPIYTDVTTPSSCQSKGSSARTCYPKRWHLHHRREEKHAYSLTWKYVYRCPALESLGDQFDAFLEIAGFNRPLATLWEVVPWSWLIDWVFNFQSIVDLLESRLFGASSLVQTDILEMCLVDYQRVAWETWLRADCESPSLTCLSKGDYVSLLRYTGPGVIETIVDPPLAERLLSKMMSFNLLFSARRSSILAGVGMQRAIGSLNSFQGLLKAWSRHHS